MQIQKIRTLLEESWLLRYSNPGRAMELAEQCFSLSNAEEYSLGISCSEGMKGVCQFLLNKREMVFELLERAIIYLERNPDHLWHARFLVFYANASHNAGLLSQAITSVKKAVRLATTSGSFSILADAYAMQGTIYRNVSLFEESLEAFMSSLEMRRKEGDKRSFASSLNQIAYSYATMNDYGKSLDYYSQSEQIRRDEGFESDLGYTYLGKASVYERIADNPQTEDYFQRGLEIATKFGDRRLECHCSLGLGKLNLKLNNLESAGSLLNRALDISRSIGASELKQIVLLSLSELQEKEGDNRNALLSLKEHLSLKSELGVVETVSRMHKETISLLNDMDSSLRYARRIQQAILPSEDYLRDHLASHFIINQPFISDSIGGDFYFCLEKNGIIYFAVADCTGHGIPGAMTSMLAHTSIRIAINDEGIDEPGKILDFCKGYFSTVLRTDEIDGEINDGMDITLISFSKETRKLFMASANNPLYQVRKEHLYEHKGNHGSISKTTHIEKFDTVEISCEPGDIFYFSSDGFKDQFGGKDNKKFGSKKLKELLLSVQDLSLSSQKEAILNTLNQWIGPEQQVDDILVAGVIII